MAHKTKQTTNHILMVRPAHFGFNEQTASSNAFQQQDDSISPEEIKQKAIEEFNGFVELLRAAGVHIIAVEDTTEPVKTDAVFPNNWVTFHEDGTVITYPMFAPVRRAERREDILEILKDHFCINRRIYLEYSESKNKFLEGTGSMVLDRIHKVVYACVSPRTDIGLLEEFCQFTGYEMLVFTAVDGKGKEIYHTNVMMTLGENFAVICLDAITNAAERTLVEKKLEASQKEVIPITLDQMMAFAGNMLQVRNNGGEPILVMSEQAFQSLRQDQVRCLNQLSNLLHVPLYTIEKYGGGSARCMMAEVFLPEA